MTCLAHASKTYSEEKEAEAEIEVEAEAVTVEEVLTDVAGVTGTKDEVVAKTGAVAEIVIEDAAEVEAEIGEAEAKKDMEESVAGVDPLTEIGVVKSLIGAASAEVQCDHMSLFGNQALNSLLKNVMLGQFFVCSSLQEFGHVIWKNFSPQLERFVMLD